MDLGEPPSPPNFEFGFPNLRRPPTPGFCHSPNGFGAPGFNQSAPNFPMSPTGSSHPILPLNSHGSQTGKGVEKKKKKVFL